MKDQVINRLFILIVLIVIVISCNSQNPSKLYSSNKEHKNPKGYFSVFPPKEVAIKGSPNDTRGKDHFEKNDNNNLMTLTTITIV